MNTVLAYLKLMRPANILTAVADIMLGFAASGIAVKFLYDGEFWFRIEEIGSLYWLIISTVGLYGGGVVFNDVFDAKLDKVERPERPIPSGKASEKGAVVLGSALLVTGVCAAFMVSVTSSIIALSIAILALVYDKYSKHHSLLGPINMGVCRGGNLLLGVSVIPAAINQLWFLGLIPVFYIGAITLISQGEVHGTSKKTIENGLLLYLLMLLGILNLGLLERFKLLHSLPFLLLFLIITMPSWLAAWKKGSPIEIRRAVKKGVLSLIILDASLAAGFAGFEFGMLVLLLLPLSLWIAKRFAVT